MFSANVLRRSRIVPRSLETALLLLSACVLAYQVVLVRAFSIGQWHHFAYMIISVALLGFGASGTLLAVLNRRKENSGFQQLAAFRSTWFALSAVAFSVALPTSFWLTQRIPFEPFLVLWDKQQLFYLGCFYLALFLPFFAAATAIGLVLTMDSEDCPRLYAFNLVGSGLGAIFAVFALSIASVERCVFIVLMVAEAAVVLAVLDVRRHAERGRRPLLVLLSIAGMCVLNLIFFLYPPSIRISQYKGLSYALNLPQARIVAVRSSVFGRVDVVASPAIRLAPGLSLASPETLVLPRQLGLYVDAETAGAITQFSGDFSTLSYLDALTTAAPYFTSSIRTPHFSVCVLGAGGGASTLLALRHGAERVDAVELNPDVPGLLRTQFRDFSGGVYNRPEVNLHRAEARAFVQASQSNWDVIDLSPLDSFSGSAVGAGVVAENYLYTREAFEAFLHHLRPGGTLAVTGWVRMPPRDELRLFTTAVAALERMGLSPADRLVLIRSWATATLLVKNDPFTSSELSNLLNWAEQHLFDASYFPGIMPGQSNRFNVLERDYYFEAANSILAQPQIRASFLQNYAFNLEPATDQKPYFLHILRWRSLPWLLGEIRHSSIPFFELGFLILIATLVQGTILAVILIVSPLLLQRRPASDKDVQRSRLARPPFVRLRVFLYFVALGFGYLFVEMALIQRVVFFLGSPIYSVAFVLASLLLVSGLGSAFAAWRTRKGASMVRLAWLSAIMVAAVSLTYAFGLYPALTVLLGWPLPARMVVALLAILPLAAMGVPFPLILRYLGQNYGDLLPWAWAVNGCASVIAGSLATLLALGTGLPGVLICASVCYVLAALVAATWYSNYPWGRKTSPFRAGI